MNEFEFISQLENYFGKEISGIGDDAALFSSKYLISKDILVENTHFLPSTPINHVISKLFNSNISDIASMGGIAKYVLFATAINNKNMLNDIFDAVTKTCKKYGIKLIGGDTASSKLLSFFSLTIIGQKGKYVIARNGAKEHDIIYISRPLGLSKISLEKELGIYDFNIDKYLHYNQEAETELGFFLGSQKSVTSMTDISDGLGIDLYNISKSSNKKAVINGDNLDLSYLDKYNIDKEEYFLSSGEEYALLFTVKEKNSLQLEKDIYEKFKRKIIPVGKMYTGSGVYISKQGALKDVSNKGYEHFIQNNKKI